MINSTTAGNSILDTNNGTSNLTIDTQLVIAIFASMIKRRAEGRSVDEPDIINNINSETKNKWEKNGGEKWSERIRWMLSNLSNNRWVYNTNGGKYQKKPKDKKSGKTATWKPGIIEKKHGIRTFNISEDADEYLKYTLEKYCEHIDSIDIDGDDISIYHDLSLIDENKIIINDEDFIAIYNYLENKKKLPDAILEKTYEIYQYD